MYPFCFSIITAGLFLTFATASPASGQVLTLDNGVIKVGADLGAGGAITYLSESGSATNLINNFDRGRQVQQSYYAGDRIDRTDEGQHPSWSPWPWNPIQVGDAFGNSSDVLEHTHTDDLIYTRTHPLLWDMENEFGECHFETWVTLDRNTVHVRNRLTCFRTDDRWHARNTHQELPAVYTIGELPTLYTYEGDAPFTHAPLTEIEGTFPWEDWTGQEKWAAHVNDAFWGVGVYNGTAELFVGGFAGSDGGGTKDFSTGYISPLRTMALDKDTVYEYEYDLIVGELEGIRAFAYNREGHPDYDGDGLSYDHETRDLEDTRPGLQSPFDPADADTSGDAFSDEPDGVPDGENDYDGDGVSNRNEVQAGSDPFDPASTPAAMPAAGAAALTAGVHVEP